MPRKLLPLATTLGLLIAPALAYAAPQAAVELHARATVSHAELAENTAKGLATPVALATAAADACELRCILANPDAANPDMDRLVCEFGEVRSIQDGFEVTATWSEAGVTFQPTESLDIESCR